MSTIKISTRTMDTGIPIPRDLPEYLCDLLPSPSSISTAHFEDGRSYSVYCSEVNNWGGNWIEDAKAYYAALQPKEGNP